MLQARGLRRLYDGRGVDGVDLSVPAGEVLGLIGPNGCGKSTLLLLLAGLVEATEGQVLIEGAPAHQAARRALGQVGLITAEPGLYPLLTGRENLRFFGGLFGLKPAQVAERAAPLLVELGLGEELDRRVATYSSGMKQKLSLARALLMDPRVLLLDEPTANLDPLSALSIWRLIRARAASGLAVVVVSHDLNALTQVCDRVCVMRAGRLVAEHHVSEPGAPVETVLHRLLRQTGEG